MWKCVIELTNRAIRPNCAGENTRLHGCDIPDSFDASSFASCESRIGSIPFPGWIGGRYSHFVQKLEDCSKCGSTGNDASVWIGSVSLPLADRAVVLTKYHAVGCAIAYGLYHTFRLDEGVGQINFGVYLLFIGVAMAITVRGA
jgi:hypothetical protein